MNSPITRAAMCHRKDGFGLILDIDEATERGFGWSRDEWVGHRTMEFLHPDDHEDAVEGWFELLETRGTPVVFRLRWRCADGSFVWVEATNVNLLDTDGWITSDLAIIDPPADGRPSHRKLQVSGGDASESPTTGLTMIEQMLREHDRLVSRLTESLPYGIAQIGTSRVVLHANSHLIELFGISMPRTVDDVIAHVVPEDAALLLEAFDRAVTSRVGADLEVSCEPKTLPPRQLMVNIRAFSDEWGTEALLCAEDVTDRRRLREELERRANYDQLTSCLNRHSVFAELAGRLHDDSGASVIFIDLDGFKAVNDRFGHAAGDDLLREVGARLRTIAGDTMSVGRIGGDEFLLVCPPGTSSTAMVDTANAISESLARPTRIGDRELPIRCSIGVAIGLLPDRRADQLIAAADSAMYRAKRRGGGVELAVLGDEAQLTFQT